MHDVIKTRNLRVKMHHWNTDKNNVAFPREDGVCWGLKCLAAGKVSQTVQTQPKQCVWDGVVFRKGSPLVSKT